MSVLSISLILAKRFGKLVATFEAMGLLSTRMIAGDRSPETGEGRVPRSAVEWLKGSTEEKGVSR